MKNKHYKRWTQEEIDFVRKSRKKGMKWREICQKLELLYSRKTTPTNISRFVRPRKKPVKVEKVVEEIVEPKEKKWASNRCAYTPQQELGIMVDFPNLSIDEMREKYQRDYRALAGRYEDIWDSEEPSRIALVMEASHVVALRKAEEEEDATEPRMGWFERRRMRRVARKAAKIQKRLDRMATKYGAILTKGDE